MSTIPVIKSEILTGNIIKPEHVKSIYNRLFTSRIINSSASVSADDGMVLMDTTSSSLTATLPDAQINLGETYIFQKTDGTPNYYTIKDVGGNTIIRDNSPNMLFVHSHYNSLSAYEWIVLKAQTNNPTFSGTASFDVVKTKQLYSTPISLTGGNFSIQCVSGNVFDLVITSSTTATFFNMQNTQTVILSINNPATSSLSATFIDNGGATIRWIDGLQDMQTASGIDIYTFLKIGDKIYGAISQGY